MLPFLNLLLFWMDYRRTFAVFRADAMAKERAGERERISKSV